MKQIYQEIEKKLQSGEPVVLLTEIPADQSPLRKMIWSEDQANETDPKDETVEDVIARALQEGQPVTLQQENQTILAEPFYPKERLIVLGGGHIALPLVEFAAKTGFSVTVVDDRPAFANEARFPLAEQVVCETFDRCFDTLKLTPFDYIVIITRGHKHDALCLRKIFAAKESVYLGMIGSKHRVSGLKQLLMEEGLDAERMERICTPIGLPIGAITPEEIAISILAQVIERKRKGSQKRGFINRSEVDLNVVNTIAHQDTDSCTVVTVMGTKGSSPRGPGAKMIVYPNQRIAGSIGGGCSEAAVIWDAMAMIGTGGHAVQTIDLTGDVAESEGMVCGGIMKVLLEDLRRVEK